MYWAWCRIPPPNSTTVQGLPIQGTHMDKKAYVITTGRRKALYASCITGPLSVTYLFTPNSTWDETGSTQRLQNPTKVLDVAQPAALQMSVREVALARA